jgi:hypothetical protein
MQKSMFTQKQVQMMKNRNIQIIKHMGGILEYGEVTLDDTSSDINSMIYDVYDSENPTYEFYEIIVDNKCECSDLVDNSKIKDILLKLIEPASTKTI